MRKKICLLEIFILIAAGFSFSYFMHESSGLIDFGAEEEKGISWLRENILGYLSNGLASAQENGLWTCLRDLNGSICQEYPADICDGLCSDNCIPARRENTQECQLGTCYDSIEGTCSAQSPKLACESSGGSWFEQEPSQCRTGCCLIGGGANYITEQACNTLSDRLGISGEWEEVENELECLLLAEEQEQGACVLEEAEPGLRDCDFTTKAECLSRGGEFNSGLLCTNPSLNTVCQRTKQTSCFADKDGVYFIDTCGNRANIYDTNKKNNNEYWNRVFSRNESCSLDEDLGNQESCGNCDYLLGNLCGEPREGIDQNPLEGDFICRDLSCVDEWGDERKNGESWCAYDSQIGVDNEGDGNKGRSVDVPGSRHYRKVCLDGEVRTEPCADFRNEICSESRDEEIEFSSAACRINRWQQCIEANTDKTKLNKCETNSDCFLKEVRIDDFKFDVCAAKYPPGFDLRADFGGEVGESICSLASQKCKQVCVKGFGGWDCSNSKCSEPIFTETMNNLCISLGDCGGNVNLEGDFTSSGYSVKKAPKLNEKYISGLRDYAGAVKGQRAEPLPLNETAALFGLDASDPEFDSQMGKIIAGLGAGATGISFIMGVIQFGGLANTISYLQATGFEGIKDVLAVGGQELGTFGAGLSSAAAGGAIAFILGSLFGLEGEALTAVTILGAVTGLFTYTGIPGLFDGFALFSYSWLLWTVIIIIILILIFKLFGIGDTEIRTIAFTCSPWQPPLGGADCEKCTESELGCSKYKCQSLGQTCEFVNEGTGEEACINIAPDDALAPRITPWDEPLTEGFEYADVTDRSFKVIHSENECIPAYTQVTFGISLNEFGQCKYDTERKPFDEMEFYFGESSLFKKNHVTAISLPSLESLGEGGFDPNRRADFDLFVRCQDGNGKKNEDDFTIRFCVSPENDITPPILQRFAPESPAYAALDATELNLTFFTNEPSECRYSATDEEYNSMQNQIACANNVSEMTLFGFECNSVLPVGAGNTTEHYLRCKDKPWEIDNEKRNANRQSFVYEIIKTTEPLVIEEIRLNPEPDESGIISAGAAPVSVRVEVETSGGAPVNTYCTYGFNGRNDLARFFESGADTHKQTFNSLFEGDYNLGIRCEDEAGNSAEGSVQFTVEVDDTGPAITRIYAQGNSLYVITNEDSMCHYSHNSCSFSTEDENVFEMSGSGLVHTADFNPQINYYIKCRDDWGNTGSCTTVRAGY